MPNHARATYKLFKIYNNTASGALEKQEHKEETANSRFGNEIQTHKHITF